MAVLVRPRTRGVVKPGPGAIINMGHPLGQGMVAAWLMSASAGANAIDHSPYQAHGRLVNGTTHAPGPFGNTINFNGTDGYISYAHKPQYDFERTDPFSAAMWIYRNANTNATDLLTKGLLPGNNFQGYRLCYIEPNSGFAYAANTVFFDLINTIGGNNYIRVRTTGTISVGVWTHYAVTYDGSSTAAGVTMYINGVPQPTVTERDTLSASIKVTTPLYSSNTEQMLGGFFNGKLDDVLLWRRRLPPSAVKWLYTEPKAFLVPPAPKILYFALSAPGGTTVTGTQALETDTGNVGAARITVVGSQAQETDTANAGVARVAVAGSQATETDTANAGVARVTRVGSQATETDSGNVGVVRVTAVGSQAQESDIGNVGSAISGAGNVAGAKATESDVGNAGTAVQRWIGTQATETDTAFAGVARITRVGSQSTETDTGNAGIVLRRIVGTQATEIDLGNAGTTVGGTVTIHPETGTVTVDPPKRTATVVVTR